jgi:hypothetical protein
MTRRHAMNRASILAPPGVKHIGGRSEHCYLNGFPDWKTHNMPIE